MTATYDAATVNGIRMHYLRAGSGPLLVLRTAGHRRATGGAS
jgi:hypothetical protein